MKKITASLLLTVILLGTSYTAQSQGNPNFRLFEQYRGEGVLSYNFFTGPDAATFTTSIDGFGSGILDAFSGRSSIDIIQLGSTKLFLSLGAGFAIHKFRLTKNLIFGMAEDQSLTWAPDPDTSHNYVNTFFGYGKSKIITTSFYFPMDLNVALGKNMIATVGGYLDLNVTARYKMKYLVGDDKVKEIIRSAEFRKFNPSTTKFGVNATLLHKKLGYGLSASYSLTPFFRAGMGPDIHEARISASYTIGNLKEESGKREK